AGCKGRGQHAWTSRKRIMLEDSSREKRMTNQCALNSRVHAVSFRDLSARITSGYRGRLAPSPTGYLHLGHARTFWIAQQRAQAERGTLILRNEDLDPHRSKPEFAAAMFEDLKWFGFTWREGPDCGGPFAPYNQSERRTFYTEALATLRDLGFTYPCTCSRKDIQRAC